MAELTKEYFDTVVKGLATKEDLKDYAKKIDLEDFVTKDYLRISLEKYVTKDEFYKEMTEVKADIAEIKELLPSKELISNLYQLADRMAKEVAGYREEQSVTGYRMDHLESWARKAGRTIDIEFKR